MSQIALPLAWPAAEDERDFIVTGANQVAVRHLEHWSLWPVMATILSGPRKSGRSLLGRIFAAKSGGTLVDDAERQDEEAIFHAWNAAQSSRRPLLLIADEAPGGWNVALPDLRSRLVASPHVAIDAPDEELAAPLIVKLLTARRLDAPPDVIRYLVPRIERTYVAIDRVVDAIDQIALERRNRITIPIARDALAMIGVIDESR